MSSGKSDLCEPGIMFSWQMPKLELTSRREQVSHSVQELKIKYLPFSIHGWWDL